MSDAKKTWGAPLRNTEPILAKLRVHLPSAARVLEIASGTGQHAAAFTRAEPSWQWWPSDVDEENLASIAAWKDEGGPGFHPPRRLDVMEPWPESEGWDAVFCANMIHIAPEETVQALMVGAARAAVGRLILYGPFKVDGAYRGEGDARFDASLRERDREWGIRDLEDVLTTASAAGFREHARESMPANNLLLVLVR